MAMLRTGERIVWQYDHFLGTGTILITKHGEYIGLVRHTCKHWLKDNAVQIARVKFDGNKRCSFVALHGLHRELDI